MNPYLNNNKDKLCLPRVNATHYDVPSYENLCLEDRMSDTRESHLPLYSRTSHPLLMPPALQARIYNLEQLHMQSVSLNHRLQTLSASNAQQQHTQILAAKLEQDVCLFLSQIVHFLEGYTWKMRSDDLFATELTEKEVHVFQSHINTVLCFIEQFNSIWFERFAADRWQRKHFHRDVLTEIEWNQSDDMFNSAGKSRYLFQNYGMFHSLQRWRFEIDEIETPAQGMLYMLWEKENTPITVVETLFNNVFLLYDSSTYSTQSTPQVPVASSVSHESVGSSTQILKDQHYQIHKMCAFLKYMRDFIKRKNELTVQNMMEVLTGIKYFYEEMQRANFKAVFLQKDIFLMDYLDAVFHSFLLSYTQEAQDSDDAKIVMINRFLIVNAVIMENLVPDWNDNARSTNFDIYKQKFGNTLQEKLGSNDYALFLLVDEIFHDLCNSFQIESISYNKSLAYFFTREIGNSANVNRDACSAAKQQYPRKVIQHLQHIKTKNSRRKKSDSRYDLAVESIIKYWNKYKINRPNPPTAIPMVKDANPKPAE